jgi:polysaccharide deacetylase family protein (PEP-CTERM system associated)
VKQGQLLNALTVDVEDYFHVEAFASHISPKDWMSYVPRVERNTFRALELFDEYKARATFFILGWVADRFPGLIRQIAAAGHEIASHGFSHQLISRQTPDQFRMDVRKSRDTLTNQVQAAVTCYRAPSFSITRKTLWAIEILAEEGFKIDSSIYPVRHDLYGMPEAPRFPYWHSIVNGLRLFEFPPSTIRIGNLNLGVAGGGYLRHFPYSISHMAIRIINNIEHMPAIVYFHPWELDPDQPRIPAKLRSRLRHYTHLSTMESKLSKLLHNVRFSTITHVSETLENYNLHSIPNAALPQDIRSTGRIDFPDPQI